ncbi:MAG TPA: acyloxyacyl hydrolase, partial [Chitinophagaceae bacterium]|nr:acyloxyacyl hydrolase [Chitinophagaceae bacterium]
MKVWYWFFCLFPYWVNAQDSMMQKLPVFGVNAMAGKLFLHTKKIHIEAPPISPSIELTYGFQSNGNKEWQQRFGFPETSMSLCFASQGDAKLGWAVGLFPSIRFHVKSFEHGYVFAKLGGGIGLASKHWHRLPYTDSFNNVVGSTVNNFTMFQLGYRQQIKKNWTLDAGVFFHHLSNASARQPNFGYNTYGLVLGAAYHPNGFQSKFKKRYFSPTPQPIQFLTKMIVARSEEKVNDGPVYTTYGLTLAATKLVRHKARLMVGADVAYYTKWYALYKNSGLFDGQERLHSFRYSVFVANEFTFGRVGFPLQLGVYLNRPIQGPKIY